MSPTARTLAALRELGMVAEVVERTIPHTFIKIDFIGCIDIIAFSHEEGIIGIQVTSGSNHAARRAKILAEPRAHKWLACGGRIQVWSWRKGGAAGARKVYTSRVEEITSGDIQTLDAPA